MQKQCQTCGKEFETKRKDKKTCSDSCRSIAYNRRQDKKNLVNASFVEKISEDHLPCDICGKMTHRVHMGSQAFKYRGQRVVILVCRKHFQSDFNLSPEVIDQARKVAIDMGKRFQENVIETVNGLRGGEV